jgi:hypothetical protein
LSHVIDVYSKSSWIEEKCQFSINDLGATIGANICGSTQGNGVSWSNSVQLIHTLLSMILNVVVKIVNESFDITRELSARSL